MARRRRYWLSFLVGGPLLGLTAFGGGVVVTDRLEQNNRFCISCHLHQQKYREYHPVQGERLTLAAAHNLEGERHVKCIDCHIGATLVDKVAIKALAARDTVAFFLGAYKEPDHLRYELGNRTCLKCHPTGGKNPEDKGAFHNPPYHDNMPLLCYRCHAVHPQAPAETGYLRREAVRPLCDACHAQLEQ
ncbi:MAG: hypothetical protein KatS3mg131_3424 [Candidatus Tectimicrobiota bacterium]|nr:MAG: hypothetical protein KatS3mg131_3424 [Candidatus Tectomicrobia bacterium]